MSTMKPSALELVQWLEAALAKYKEQWGDNPAFRTKSPIGGIVAGEVARLAYQAGADAELEACCGYIGSDGKWFASPYCRLNELRAARRPKPPSLKQEAVAALGRLTHGSRSHEAELICRALASLPDE
jgi:hypothetical protein